MGGSPHDSPAKQLAAMLRSTLRSPSMDGAQPTVGIPETLAGGEHYSSRCLIFCLLSVLRSTIPRSADARVMLIRRPTDCSSCSAMYAGSSENKYECFC